MNGKKSEKKSEKIHGAFTSFKSNKKGPWRLLESIIRRFRNMAFLLMIMPLAVLVGILIGVAVCPGFFIALNFYNWTKDQPLLFHVTSMILAFGLGFLAFILTLVFAVPLANFLLPFRVKHLRGAAYSLETIPWYFHNALTYLVRYTILDFITPTPLNILFFRMMGMKIGKGVILNTSNISDPCLIEIEDYVTVGGSSTLMAHYGVGGLLCISKTIIKKGATIGLSAAIMGDTVVGEYATVKPHSVVLPKSRIQPHATI